MKYVFALLLFSVSIRAQSFENGQVEMSVTPNKSFILPGSASNCTDYANFKVALNNELRVGLLGSSVQGLRASFPKFSLAWNGQHELSVLIVRITIKSDSLSGGKYSYDVFGEELEALIGGQTAMNFGKKGLMNSNDALRDCDPDTHTNVITGLSCKAESGAFSPYYAACGLGFGGIVLANPFVREFKAPVKIELYGSTKDTSGKHHSVYSIANAEVEFSGLQ